MVPSSRNGLVSLENVDYFENVRMSAYHQVVDRAMVRFQVVVASRTSWGKVRPNGLVECPFELSVPEVSHKPLHFMWLVVEYHLPSFRDPVTRNEGQFRQTLDPMSKLVVSCVTRLEAESIHIADDALCKVKLAVLDADLGEAETEGRYHSLFKVAEHNCW